MNDLKTRMMQALSNVQETKESLFIANCSDDGFGGDDDEEVLVVITKVALQLRSGRCHNVKLCEWARYFRQLERLKHLAIRLPINERDNVAKLNHLRVNFGFSPLEGYRKKNA